MQISQCLDTFFLVMLDTIHSGDRKDKYKVLHKKVGHENQNSCCSKFLQQSMCCFSDTGHVRQHCLQWPHLLLHPEETRHVSCAFNQSRWSFSGMTGQTRCEPAKTNTSASQLSLLFRSKTSRILLRRKVDLLGLVRGLMGPLGSYHYFTQSRPFQVGVKQSMKLFMALSNEALLIHQGVFVREWCRWDILSLAPLGLFICFVPIIWVINAVIKSNLRQSFSFY